MAYFGTVKFLIIQQKMIGDVLTSTILCSNLKHRFPDGSIDFVANENTLAVLEGNPHIDTIIIFKKKYKKSKRALLKFLNTLKNTQYDVLIDAYGKIESNLISIFTSANIKISYHKWYTHFIYTHPLKRYYTPDPEMGLAIKNRLLLIEPLLSATTPRITQPRLYLCEGELTEAALFLKSHHIDPCQPLIMLSILGSSPSKTYPLPYMAAVINTIVHTATGVTLLFNYIPEQKTTATTLYELCSPEAKKHIKFRVFASSLRSFLGVLHHCNALIGNEGGAIHMAQAIPIPTFSIFSPWIDKATWHLINDTKNVAVHLKDFKPLLYEGKSQQQLKKDVANLYDCFSPSYVEAQLHNFLNTVL